MGDGGLGLGAIYLSFIKAPKKKSFSQIFKAMLFLVIKLQTLI